jgi:hypothetical protein
MCVEAARAREGELTIGRSYSATSSSPSMAKRSLCAAYAVRHLFAHATRAERVAAIRSSTGEHLYTLRQPFVALGGTFKAVSPYDKDVTFFETEQHWSLGGTKMDVVFQNRIGHGERLQLRLKGCAHLPLHLHPADRKAGRSWAALPR